MQLRVLRIRTADGQPHSVFIALTDAELGDVVRSNGDLAPVKKHIPLVVGNDTPSPRDYYDARQAFAQCYGSSYRGRGGRAEPSAAPDQIH